jgi:hypothetical protein
MKEFDELLDGVLQEDGRVEPQPGLERRIQVRVQAEMTRVSGWSRWWRFGLVPLVTCVVVVITVHHRSGHETVPAPVVASASKIAASDDAGSAKSAEQLSNASLSYRTNRTKEEALRVHHQTAAVEESVREIRLPKMETFPAVTQRGGFLPEPGNDRERDGLRAVADSSQVAQAFLELKVKQEKPLEVSAIEIKPL